MEHETYSIEPALPALQQLAARGFLTVMNSSKTAAEISALQQRLQVNAPFICENGAALYLEGLNLDAGNPVIFGQERERWLGEVHRIRAEYQLEFSGFADWSIPDIVELTGLPKEQAELASQRQYSEPILWRGAVRQKTLFENCLAEMNLQLIEGGRFFSIQGRHTKADGMRWLSERRTADRPPITVALGDSPNDTAMLEAADIAVVIKSGKSDRIELTTPRRVIRTQRPGPAGWYDAMTQILEQLENHELKLV